MEFYGRQDLLELLNKRSDALSKGYRQNMAIIGAELIGKTSLLKHWLSQYCDTRIVTVYIEIRHEEANSFGERFIGNLFFSFLKNSHNGLKDDIVFLLERCAKYIPKTTTFARKILSERYARRTEVVFAKLLELVEQFNVESGKFCVLILDEFHLLAQMPPKDIYASWRKHIMLNKNTMYVLLSSKKDLARKILAEDLALLFGNFEKIDLQPFDNKTSSAFIRDKLKSLSVSEQILSFIVNLSSGKPFYLNAICDALMNYHLKSAREANLTFDFFVRSQEDIFIGEWGILNRRFLILTQQVDAVFKDAAVFNVLTALASGKNSISDIAHRCARPKKYVSSILNKLYEEDFISRNADVYILDDALFALWLRCVYAKKTGVFTAEPEKERELFKRELESLFTDFRDAQTKEISQRLMELFGKFNNESIEVHKKRLRLNLFKEIKLLDLGAAKQPGKGIIARCPGAVWIAGFKEDRAREEDMIEFVEFCKRFKYGKTQSQKRIFIALNEIDANASLIAKEEKISTWDTALVNSLFDIYGKPRIV